MPVYEFYCRDCDKTFELVEAISEHDPSRVVCPDCRGKNVEWHPTRVSAITSKKS
jgi:putative FmdB family regulatory protein